MSNGSDDENSTRALNPTRAREVRPRRDAPAPGQQGGGSADTRILEGGKPSAPPPGLRSEPPPERPAAPGPAAGEENRTIIRPIAKRPPEPAAAVHEQQAEPGSPSMMSEHMSSAEASIERYGPVVGWLVILSGPGRGHALVFHEGMNSVGREPGENVVALGYGDQRISRKEHFFVTYDPRDRKFYVNHGGKTNLVRMNGGIVGQFTEMPAGATIEVGETKLRFVPLCGPDFTWDENS